MITALTRKPRLQTIVEMRTLQRSGFLDPFKTVLIRWAIGSLLLLSSVARAGSPALPLAVPGMVEVTTTGQRLQGALLAWDSREILILSPFGHAARVSRDAVTAVRKAGGQFVPSSFDQLRAALTKEFGKEYAVGSSPHYLVVQPAGLAERWTDVLESFYRQAWRYARQRQLPVAAPVFPMVFVIYKDQASFARSPEVRKMKPHLTEVMGAYDPMSNRCVTFLSQTRQATSGKPGEANGMLAVIRHEAFHQFAANTGLQSRFVETPTWLAEGMAMLFENELGSEDRGILAAFDGAFNNRGPDRSVSRIGWLKSLIESDALFDSHPKMAYLLSAATVSYLNARYSTQFADYLRQIQSRPPFSTYPADQRLKDFGKTFGTAWEKMERDILRSVGR